MKKLFTLLMATLMILTLAVPAFATEASAVEKGSITINKISEENVYSIYKILHLESYNKESGKYSYTIEPGWENFFTSDDAAAYVSVSDNKYVTWDEGKDSAAEVAAFAKLALAYAKANDITPVKSSENSGEFTVTIDPSTQNTSGKFTDLELGYYLVDSTMGALCGLTTTNPDASINAKNGAPTIDKQVKEDSTSQWAEQNSADIAQTVEFRVTINVHAGAENYVLHDVMSEGLTFDKVTTVEHVIPGTESSTDVAVAGTDYTIVTDSVSDGCTFEIRFSEAFCEHLSMNDKVVVYYQAMLNKKAVIAGEGNDNTAWLSFGEDHETAKDSTKTFTYGFDLVKTDSQNERIDGATFKIYDAATGGNEVAVVLMDDGVTYRRARADETGVEILVKDGKVRLVGFDNGTYYLEEIAPPVGYNKLSTRQAFTISDGNLDAVFNDGIYSTGSGVHVVNKSGSMLPETGGLGTTLFIVIGSVLALGTGVLLVTKKRMSKLAD